MNFYARRSRVVYLCRAPELHRSFILKTLATKAEGVFSYHKFVLDKVIDDHHPWPGLQTLFSIAKLIELQALAEGFKFLLDLRRFSRAARGENPPQGPVRKLYHVGDCLTI